MTKNNLLAVTLLLLGHSLCSAQSPEGSIFGWGSGIGDGTDSFRIKSTMIGSKSNWIDISSSYDAFHSIDSDGILYGWGTNRNGLVGNGNRSPVKSPEIIDSTIKWSQVETGANIALGISQGGMLYSWGLDGDTINKRPHRVGNKSDWVSVAAGYSEMVAINSNGELYTWGATFDDSSWTNLSLPTRKGRATNWRGVSAGMYFSIAINANGEMFSWGQNQYGKLGLGRVNNDYFLPQRIGQKSDWEKVSAGTDHAVAITNDGKLFFWGYLGRPSGLDSFYAVPTQVGISTNWIDISAHQNYSIALNELGQIYIFGMPTVEPWLTDYDGLKKLGEPNNYFKISAGGYGTFHAIGQKASSNVESIQKSSDFLIYPNPLNNFNDIECNFCLEDDIIFLHNIEGSKVYNGTLRDLKGGNFNEPGFYTFMVTRKGTVAHRIKLLLME